MKTLDRAIIIRSLGALALGFGVLMVAVACSAFLLPEAVFVKLMQYGGYIWIALAILFYPIARWLLKIQ